MKRVAILTDFLSHDPAYSLCGVVANQVKMLVQNGYMPRVIVRDGFPVADHPYAGAKVVTVDPGEVAQNKVNVTGKSGTEIELLTNQLTYEMIEPDKVDVVLTHDIIYQANAWKYHVAIQRIAKEHPDIFWLHWVHSTTPMNVSDQTKQFASELAAPIPNSKLVVMNAEETSRKASTFGYEINEVVLCPNPYDVAAYYTDEAKAILERSNAWLADFVCVYPARLDRGKQVEVAIEIFQHIARAGYSVRIIVPDFHSTEGDKETYRTELKQNALERGVPIFFTSDLGIDKPLYRVAHETVINLFNFADIFIHASRSECDPLTLPEAMWERNQLVLNFDLPMFRLYDQYAMMGKFSSNVDVTTGLAGETNTGYSNRKDYMGEIAGGVLHLILTSMGNEGHRYVRLNRSLHAVWKNRLLPALGGKHIE